MQVGIGDVLYKLMTATDGKTVGVERCIIIGEEGPGMEIELTGPRAGKRVYGKWTVWNILGLDTGRIYSAYTHHGLDGYYTRYQDAVDVGLKRMEELLARHTKVQEQTQKVHDHFVKLANELQVA